MNNTNDMIKCKIAVKLYKKDLSTELKTFTTHFFPAPLLSVYSQIDNSLKRTLGNQDTFLSYEIVSYELLKVDKFYKYEVQLMKTSEEETTYRAIVIIAEDIATATGKANAMVYKLNYDRITSIEEKEAI